VVFGGDGTVHEVVNGIAGREGVELAVVPRGTGRDFVRTHGIPKRLADALRIAQEGERARSTSAVPRPSRDHDETAWLRMPAASA
jgi:diacylglycerol kinase family enzyme